MYYLFRTFFSAKTSQALQERLAQASRKALRFCYRNTGQPMSKSIRRNAKRNVACSRQADKP
jgi:hypothetical protein